MITHPVAAAVACVLACACIDSQSVDCGGGTVCPQGTVCAPITNPAPTTLCVSPAQLAACAAQADHVHCMTGGRCYDHVCLPDVCGNGRLDSADPGTPGDPGEVCDDGNNASNDGCAADCKSNETCGNGVVDGIRLEQCDDGNLIDHDGCDSRCFPEQARWTELALDALGPRSTQMVYDSVHQQVVLFGGIGSGVKFGDTWLWNGVGWARARPSSSPPARILHAMAYDRARGRVVLFGGVGANLEPLDDTWEWDGENWSLASTPVSPPARRGAAMAYDAGRHRVVLFGGESMGGTAVSCLADTWEWDGQAWLAVPTQTLPPNCSGVAMAYDPTQARVVLFGGESRTSILNNPYTIFYATTLVYDGVDWSAVTPATSPGARTGARLAWDVASQRLLLFGGLTSSSATLDETWAWDGQTWNPQSGSPRPSARETFGMAADTGRGEIVVFGDATETTATTWLWRGTSWTDATVTIATPSDTHFTAAYDPTRGVAVIQDGANAVTLVIDDAGVRAVAQVPFPARIDGAIAYDVAHDRAVLFGGLVGATTPTGETWLWDGGAWQQANPVHAPSTRVTSMTDDVARGRVVLFGGSPDPSSFAPALDDTWLWDGTDWTLATPVHHPPPRVYDAIGYDPVHAQVVVFGGEASRSGGLYADTWVWDGVDWTDKTPPVSPTARSQTSLAWNASRGRLVLYGGGGTDLWEWDGTSWLFVNAGSPPPLREGAALFPARDGNGVVMFGGNIPSALGSATPIAETWHLGFDGRTVGEVCTASVDRDGDGQAGCADPDCWFACTPLCPPGTTCDPQASRCGDGVCNAALESCRICPQDCGACTAACGDSFCDAPETLASCPGDCTP